MQSVVNNVRSEFLSDNERIKKVPVYQRNYSWTKEECLGLFNDLLRIYNEEVKEHFIGSVVYKVEDSSKNSDLIIIDGQQRLTTLYLLCKAMYDLCDKTNNKLKFMLEMIIKDDNENNTFVPIKADNEIYIKLIDNSFIDIENKGYRIYENYLLFKNEILKLNLDLDRLYKSLYNLNIVSISLSHDENPQIIFESINSTGLSLTNSDLIRNFLLMNEGYDVQEKLFEKYWFRFEEMLGVENLTSFFEHYVMVNYLSKNVTRKNMYSYFKEVYYNSDLDINEYFEHLEKYVLAYSYLVNDQNKYELNSSINTIELNRTVKSINNLDTRVSYMFLMNVIVDHNNGILNDEEIVQIFKTVESYIVRRAICGYSSSSMQKVFRYLHNQIKNNLNKLKYIDAFYYNFITTKKNTNGLFPKDDEFINELLVSNLYKNRKLCNTILYGLENHNSKSKIEFDTLTIEHVMPQTLTSSWREDLGNEYEYVHATYLNRLGNLTHTSSNSELSNNSFQDKVEMLREESHLKLNQHIIEQHKWTENEISERNIELTNKANKVWYYPEYNEQELQKAFEKEKIEINIEDMYDGRENGKPIYLEVNGFEIPFKSYKDVYNRFVEYLYVYEKVKFFEFLVNNKNYTIETKGNKYYLFSNKIQHPYGSFEIKNSNIYLFNYYNVDQIIGKIISISEGLKLDCRFIFEK